MAIICFVSARPYEPTGEWAERLPISAPNYRTTAGEDHDHLTSKMDFLRNCLVGHSLHPDVARSIHALSDRYSWYRARRWAQRLRHPAKWHGHARSFPGGGESRCQ